MKLALQKKISNFSQNVIWESEPLIFLNFSIIEIFKVLAFSILKTAVRYVAIKFEKHILKSKLWMQNGMIF